MSDTSKNLKVLMRLNRFGFSLLMGVTDSFANVKSTLHSWEKYHLILMYLSFLNIDVFVDTLLRTLYLHS